VYYWYDDKEWMSHIIQKVSPKYTYKDQEEHFVTLLTMVTSTLLIMRIIMALDLRENADARSTVNGILDH